MLNPVKKNRMRRKENQGHEVEWKGNKECQEGFISLHLIQQHYDGKVWREQR